MSGKNSPVVKMLSVSKSASLGATIAKEGVHFKVWAPKSRSVDVVFDDPSGPDFPLRKSSDGFFEGVLPGAGSGVLYRYRVDGKGPYPDPASRFQPQGVHGPSQVVDPAAFVWSDDAWRGVRLKDLIAYELHVGTFTPLGTFAGVMERLHYLRELGITALELMPVADFSGRRNWGYDGVSLFAPSHNYGEPDDLRRLVNQAHALGLGVLLDVVYNHLGPDGNYLGAFSPYYFTSRHKTPWGSAVNFDSEHAREARDFFIENAVQWVRDYHMDGLRLDATHAMMDDGPRHFLAELTNRVRSSVPDREVVLIAEDCRNLARMIKPEKEKGWGLDAVWADDFHHHVRRSLANDHEGYFEDFSGSVSDIAATIQKGWFFSGQSSKHFGGPRGTDSADIPFERFVFCLQNHDQVGNRALGERLHHQIDAARYRAASALLLTVPETPLLFMGQEWGAASPFLYFTDHHDELGKLVTEGRRGEFKAFSAFSDAAARARIPDPQDPSTFQRSRLQWSELQTDPHALLQRLYRALIQWRKKTLTRLPGGREDFTATALNDNALWLEYRQSGEPCYWILIQWRGGGSHDLMKRAAQNWEVVLTTEDSRFSSDSRPIRVEESNDRVTLQFDRTGAAILEAKP